MKWWLLIVACVVLCCACHREEPVPAGVEITIKGDGEWDGVIEQ